MDFCIICLCSSKALNAGLCCNLSVIVVIDGLTLVDDAAADDDTWGFVTLIELLVFKTVTGVTNCFSVAEVAVGGFSVIDLSELDTVYEP